MVAGFLVLLAIGKVGGWPEGVDPQFRTEIRREDYARVMPGGRYFVHADGKPFIPIGYNHNPDWPEFEEANPDRPAYRPEVAERYMAHLASNGVNILRLMIETPQSGNLESPIGTFSPGHVRWIDTIVAAARKNRIKLIVTPWDTFWMNKRFDASTYNPLHGGPLQAKLDFITSPAMRAVEKTRLKFMVDRWGNTGTIFSWELLNEADLWWGANAAQIKDWITDMAGYVRSYEKRRWGRSHMLSVSFAEAMPRDEMAVDAYDLPVLDYATTHLYIGASKAPTEPIGPALAIRQGVTYGLAHLHDDRPYMDTENGPIDKWIEDGNLDNHVFLGMIWAHLASGGAGSGFRWPYRHPHHLSEGMLGYLKVMSTFCAEVPWRELAGRHVDIAAEGDRGQAVCAVGTRKCAIVWTSGGAVNVRWLDGPASINVKAIDCQTGRWLPYDKLQSGSFSLPKATGPVAYLLTAKS